MSQVSARSCGEASEDLCTSGDRTGAFPQHAARLKVAGERGMSSHPHAKSYGNAGIGEACSVGRLDAERPIKHISKSLNFYRLISGGQTGHARRRPVCRKAETFAVKYPARQLTISSAADAGHCLCLTLNGNTLWAPLIQTIQTK
jgi:hypothetical protein